MNQMYQKIFDAFFPVAGGAGGGIVVFHNHKSYVLMMTFPELLDAFIIIIMGAVIGYFIKKLLDWAWKKCKRK